MEIKLIKKEVRSVNESEDRGKERNKIEEAKRISLKTKIKNDWFRKRNGEGKKKVK